MSISIVYEANGSVKGIVTKAFEKKAKVFNSPEYLEWKAFRADYPDAIMATKTRSSKLKKESKLTYAKIKVFIANVFEGKDIDNELKEFEKTKAISRIKAKPHEYVEAWFNNRYSKYLKEFEKQNEPTADSTKNEEPTESNTAGSTQNAGSMTKEATADSAKDKEPTESDTTSSTQNSDSMNAEAAA